MEITKRLMTKNDCYKAGRYIKPQGIVVHSTATPSVMAADWYSRWNQPGISKCVHAFLDDRGVVQYLPWTMRGWHAGGTANNTHIGFEICEPAGIVYKNNKIVSYNPPAGYFEKIWNNAIDLCVYLCKEYGLTEKDIIDHSEGNKLGIASNHGDVKHWWSLEGRTMTQFRAEVRKRLELEEEDDEMLSYEQFKEYMKKYEAERDALPGSDWSKVMRDWANKEGLVNGDEKGNMRWKAPMTREEYVTVEYRQANKN